MLACITRNFTQCLPMVDISNTGIYEPKRVAVNL